MLVSLRCADNLEWQRIETRQPAEKPKLVGAAQAASYQGIQFGDTDTPRCEHCALLWGNRMVVVGGYSTCSPKMNGKCFLPHVVILMFWCSFWFVNLC